MVHWPAKRTNAIELDGRSSVRLSEKYITDNAQRDFTLYYYDDLFTTTRLATALGSIGK